MNISPADPLPTPGQCRKFPWGGSRSLGLLEAQLAWVPVLPALPPDFRSPQVSVIQREAVAAPGWKALNICSVVGGLGRLRCWVFREG